MVKKKKKRLNNHYKLVEHVRKKNIAKIFNFRTDKVEIHLTALTKKEKALQRKKYRPSSNKRTVKKKKNFKKKCPYA